MPSKEIDMRGQICPSTLLTALREMNANKDLIRSGDLELLFVTDNRDATVTIPESAANMGYEAKVEKSGDGYQIRICKHTS